MMARVGDSTAVRHARLTLLERDSGQPMTNEERRRLLDAADLVAKSEERDAQRWSDIADAYGTPRTSAPVKAPTPVKATPRGSAPTPGTVAHLRGLFGDERTNPARFVAMPEPMRRALIRAKAEAGEGLTGEERRTLETGTREIGMQVGAKIAAKGNAR